MNTSTSPSFLESLTTLGLAYLDNQNQPAPAPALPPTPYATPGAIADRGLSLSSPLVIIGLVVVGALLWKKLG